MKSGFFSLAFYSIGGGTCRLERLEPHLNYKQTSAEPHLILQRSGVALLLCLEYKIAFNRQLLFLFRLNSVIIDQNTEIIQ